MEHDTHTKSCGTACSAGGFNYCLVAKVIVSLGAIPILAAVAASFAPTPEWQFTVAAFTGAAVVLIAQRIDRLQCLSPMLRKTKPDKD